MTTMRWWLALSAAASVPLMLYMTQRHQQRRGRLAILKDAVTDRVDATTDATRETLGSLNETTRGAAETVAATASRAAERAGAVLAAAPAIAPWSRHGDDNPAAGDGNEDWRRYSQSIGHR